MVPERPLAETCLICGRRPPRFVFFAISGSLCNAAQLGLDRLIYHSLGDELVHSWWGPTMCWSSSYMLSVSLRHVSHAAFVFGPHIDPLAVALTKTYLTYLSTIMASSAMHLTLVAGANVSHEMALVLVSFFSVGWSYAALSQTWRADGASTDFGRADGAYVRVPTTQVLRATSLASLGSSDASPSGARCSPEPPPGGDFDSDTEADRGSASALPRATSPGGLLGVDAIR